MQNGELIEQLKDVSLFVMRKETLSLKLIMCIGTPVKCGLLAAVRVCTVNDD
jgi:hypothetical protein